MTGIDLMGIIRMLLLTAMAAVVIVVVAILWIALS